MKPMKEVPAGIAVCLYPPNHPNRSRDQVLGRFEKDTEEELETEIWLEFPGS